MNKLVSLFILTWSLAAFAEVPVQEDRNEAEYNNQFAVILNGYDPVSYFAEGGGVPQKGSSNISYVYGSREYHFASQENKVHFLSDPLKYEPSYGSWCAYGMSHNAKIQINPLVYTLNGNRLHFFISKSAKKTFDGDVASHEQDADKYWDVFSSEAPRK